MISVADAMKRADTLMRVAIKMIDDLDAGYNSIEDVVLLYDGAENDASSLKMDMEHWLDVYGQNEDYI